MIDAPCTSVLPHLRRLALRHGAGDVSDEQLLRCFLADRDEAAFAALVRRHGPMVLGVCRRVLRDQHDAEDAFQATFLVLLRKARSVAEPDRLGNWLYGVAYFTARNAKTARLRRQAAERRMRELARPPSADGPREDDWRPILDAELSRLPDRYRVPLVLCELQGRSRREAAQALGWSEGTLSSRLARGRALLRRRVLRHGVALSTAVLATQTATALPAGLVQATLQATASLQKGVLAAPVAALVQGVLQAMFLTKLKIATVWLIVAGIVGAGVTVFTCEALADKPAAVQQDQAKDQKKKGEAGPSLHGVVQAVDAGKQTITVKTGDKDNVQEKTFPLAKDVKVILREGKNKNEPPKEGKLTDVGTGAGAVLYLTADEKTVTAIAPQAPKAMGAIVRVDAAQKTLTLRTKDKSGPGEQTFQLADDVKVLLNDGLKKGDPDTEGKLADLQEGTHIALHISLADQRKVLSVRVQGASLHGTVAGVDLGNSTITLTLKEDAQKVDKTITLAKDARVDSDLVVGDTASVRLSVFDKTKAIAVHKVKKDKEEE